MEAPKEIYCVYCKHCKTFEVDDYDGNPGCHNRYTICEYFNEGLDYCRNDKYYCKGFEWNRRR